MTDIVAPDPFLDHYIYEKQTNPSKRIVVRQFQKKYVDAVDYLVRISQGKREKVETSNDWMVVSKILEVWTRLYPNEWQEYIQSMQEIRTTRARRDGFSKEKGHRGIRYLAAIPPRLMKMIKVIFPHQQWDREFVDKFTNNIKVSKVGEKIDTWFTIP